MKLSGWTSTLILILSFSVIVLAKEKETSGQNVDSGSFGVFIKGQRVGTEKFSITQNGNGSVIRSEFKAEGAAGQALQNSELQLAANGEIRRYEWKEESPGKATSLVVPNDQFLTQKWTAGPDDKPQEQPYLLPAATSILDDYFFVHREILAWKYLGGACSKEKEGLRCPKAQFGTMNPRQHSSAPATMEYLGREKVKIHDAEQELNKLELKSDAGSWLIWLDEKFKMLRITIPAEGTEVVRD
ncbi:MAG TPA: hypothetical protein VNW47_12005 [Terriglobales bacterium]|nr:hypothetical protein [Terriglobales bacterium]